MLTDDEVRIESMKIPNYPLLEVRASKLHQITKNSKSDSKLLEKMIVESLNLEA